MGNNENDYFYKIVLAYEIPYNVLDSNDPDVVSIRENLNLFPKIKIQAFNSCSLWYYFQILCFIRNRRKK